MKSKRSKANGRPPRKAAVSKHPGTRSAVTAPAAEPEQGPPAGMLKDFTERAVDQWIEFQKLQGKARAASSKFRAILKDAKKAGIDPDDILWYRDTRGRDPAEIDAETRRRNRLARVMRLPIGTQLGIFEDGETVARKASRDAGDGATAADRTQLQKEAHTAGREAGRAGKNRTDNPWPLKSAAFTEWDSGWCEGQAETAAELGGVAKSGARADATALS